MCFYGTINMGYLIHVCIYHSCQGNNRILILICGWPCITFNVVKWPARCHLNISFIILVLLLFYLHLYYYNSNYTIADNLKTHHTNQHTITHTTIYIYNNFHSLLHYTSHVTIKSSAPEDGLLVARNMSSVAKYTHKDTPTRQQNQTTTHNRTHHTWQITLSAPEDGLLVARNMSSVA